MIGIDEQLKSGNTHEPHRNADYWTAGIHVGKHMHRIEVYGKTKEDAENLRDYILTTLRRMKSIKDAARELPEEPQEIKALRGYLHAEINWQIHVRADQLKICAAYIDTLRDLLAAELAINKRLVEGMTEPENPIVIEFCGERWVKNKDYDTLRYLLAAEKSRCKRLEDGLRNPTEEMISAGLAAEGHIDDEFKAMSAVLLKEVKG